MKQSNDKAVIFFEKLAVSMILTGAAVLLLDFLTFAPSFWWVYSDIYPAPRWMQLTSFYAGLAGVSLVLAGFFLFACEYVGGVISRHVRFMWDDEPFFKGFADYLRNNERI